MSYCRWSTDNFKCDLYCYGDVNGGYTTWVAGNRAIGDIPKLPDWPKPGTTPPENWAQEMTDAMKKQHDFLENCEREDITLPYAGECFNDPTLEAFRDRLIELRRVGYYFPFEIIDELEEEIKKEQSSD
jgi:hypothetical protein